MIPFDLPRVGIRNRVHFSEPKRFTGLWVGVGSAVLGAATSVYSSQQQKKLQNKALDAQKNIAADVEYKPVDIEKLKADATANAIANATASLAIERQLQPDVAATREELARQIRADLDRGGQLPVDTANQVTQSARVIGARSGAGSGSTTPLTAALLGLKSTDLIDQRRRAAGGLVAMNDLPAAGLDPGTIASLEVANNAAYNQFNLEKAGVESNLANSEAAARASQLGSQVGLINSLGSAVKNIGNIYADNRAGVGERMTYDDYIKRQGKTPTMNTPLYQPVDTSFAF
jgi:hypothetical protein